MSRKGILTDVQIDNTGTENRRHSDYNPREEVGACIASKATYHPAFVFLAGCWCLTE